MTPLEMHQGEIERTLRRIEASIAELRAEAKTDRHELRDFVNAQIGPVAVHGAKIETLELDMKDVQASVQTVRMDAARISGMGAVLAVVAALIPWPWKH